MLFNSVSFLIFFPIVFFFYWFVTKGNLKWQNILLLAASYFFYACWDYRFLFLLIFSTGLDYYTGIKMDESENQKKRSFWFWLSVIINLGFLGVFKYYNFFIGSFVEGLSYLGVSVNVWTIKVILPVGISFYTFHGLSYVIDIYNRKIKAERNFVDYSLFVSYFPLLVAGPIERATHLLPQIKQKRTFNSKNAISGIEQMIWGFFKKVVIADTMAIIVNKVFDDAASYGSVALIIGAIAFSFQIYCDFSGYSDIAIGTSKLLGIDLIQNFNFPYLSRNIAEFWRRWHISLSTWFRDYLYIPLGGSKASRLLSIRNVFIIFLVSGFWHGANWTFLIWGGIHALLFIPSFVLGSNRKYKEDIVHRNKVVPSVLDIFQMVITFLLVTIAWIFFRAATLAQAGHYLNNIVHNVKGKTLALENSDVISYSLSFAVFFTVSTYFLYRKNHLLKTTVLKQFALSLGLLILITLLGQFSQQSFIYFQF
ncbi:MBOAT family O-acyltransferase [Ferruginibacter paludis]|uniref:MBOAT family O-acyltransferase n=1 Tax=Ferruginibacter paludis TaxID=1310417 RepID=UPI0025B4EE36|nr:MBOAT family O-acyltransferase [Ferruginibacter paludis]MDN3658890.1 MBOAT family O-acyltransferase [Ferruginibacter paludis]